MHAFDIVQMRWIFIMLVGGVAMTLAILLGFFGRSLRETGRDTDEIRDADSHYREPHAIPWFLVLVWIGAGLFIVGYCVWVRYGNANF